MYLLTVRARTCCCCCCCCSLAVVWGVRVATLVGALLSRGEGVAAAGPRALLLLLTERSPLALRERGDCCGVSFAAALRCCSSS